jgi:3-hydroxyisobutyrate dehydrogenase-like beta-hydroxyacid dehydrogenase
MGQSHVANLLSKGYKNVVVWNRTASSCDSAVANGAQLATSAQDVVQRSDITFVMLSTPAAAKAVYSAPDGVLAGLSPDKGIVDCASLDAECMKELSELVEAKGGRFVSSPVAGHSGMAANATCQFICAGDESLYQEVSLPLDAMSKNKVWLGGDVTASTNLKLVVNGLLANITASMAEGLAISQKCNISSSALKEIVSGHAMNSPLLQLCMKMMLSGEHPSLFMVQHMTKDAALSNELAGKIGQASPITAATKQSYEAAMAQDLGTQNWTAVYEATKNRGVD